MSTLRDFRWLAPLCGALLLVNSSALFAQDTAVAADDNAALMAQAAAPSKTPEAAGERFYQFLATGVIMDGQSAGVPFNWARADMYVGVISRTQMADISNRPQGGKVEQLFALLAQMKDEPQYVGKVAGTEGEQTIVEVSPAPTKKREVVVVPEDGGYRVDLKATYGRWNDLSGERLDISWAEYTGIVAPALAQNTTYQANKARSSCQINLKQAMLGILQRAQDYDSHYPTARKWADDIMPYVKSEQLFRCPALPEGSNYGYAYNQNLNSLELAKLNNPAQTVAIYETEDLTRNAFGAGEERAYRHLGGSNIAFADGHVKWYLKDSEEPESVNFKP